VNGGDPAAGPTQGYNAVLRRMLGTLGEALNREEGRGTFASDGFALVDSRPASGWKDLEEIVQALGWDAAKAQAFRPYLCFQAWTDKRVIRPNAPIPPVGGMDVHSWGEIKLGRPVNASGTREPDFERIGGRNVGRAPVSLAWAAGHRPALISLIAGLSGVYLDETGAAVGEDDFVGTLKEVSIANAWNPADDCHLAVAALAATWAASPVDPDWPAFEASCDGIAFSGTPEEVQAKRDALKANFNPNSDLNKFNPNRSLWRTVDKSDLTAYSTEFSLDPVQGHLLECHGRWRDASGRILAQKTLRAMLAPPGIVRLSTQKELVCDDLGSLDLPGDESDPRLPGHPRFVSEALTPSRGWGHALDLRPRYGPSCWLDGDSGGASLQSYPEPVADAGAGLVQHLAEYDGRLELAALETPGTDAGMLARFSRGMDLDVAAGGDPKKPCLPDVSLAIGADLANGLLDPLRPSTLGPDGAYSERDRCPSWLDRGNVHGYHGVMSFWVKNNFQMLVTPRAPFRRGSRYVYWSNLNPAPQGEHQLFILGMLDEKGWAPMFGGAPEIHWQFNSGQNDGGDDTERWFCLQNLDPIAHRWRLISLFWDFRSVSADASGELLLNAGQLPTERFSSDWYLFKGGGSWPPADITVDDFPGPAGSPARPHVLSLGPCGRRPEDPYLMPPVFGKGADATFDEFGIWDMGGAPEGGGDEEPPDGGDRGGDVPPDGGDRGGDVPPDGGDGDPGPGYDPGPLPNPMASARYHEGRYYRGWAYGSLADAPLADAAAAWLSAPISLPSGSALRSVSWSFRRPQELEDDYAEIALSNPAGTAYLSTPGHSRSVLAPSWTPARRRWDPLLSVQGAFRLQAVFKRPAALAADMPILDSPSLDDLTLVYLPREGSRLLSFRCD